MNSKRGSYRYPKVGRPRHMLPYAYDDEPPPKRPRHGSQEPQSNGQVLVPLLPLPTKDKVRDEIKDLFKFSKQFYDANDPAELDFAALLKSPEGTLASRRLGSTLALTASSQLPRKAEFLAEVVLGLADQNREVGGGNGENGDGNVDGGEVVMFHEGVEEAAKALVNLMRNVEHFKDAVKYRKVVARVLDFVFAGRDQAKQDMSARRVGASGNYATPNFGHQYCSLAKKSFQSALSSRPIFVMRSLLDITKDVRGGGLKLVIEYLIQQEQENEENDSERALSNTSPTSNSLSNRGEQSKQQPQQQQDQVSIIQKALEADPEGQIELLRMFDHYRGVGVSTGNRQLEVLVNWLEGQVEIPRSLAYKRPLPEDPRIPRQESPPNALYGPPPVPMQRVREPMYSTYASRLSRT
eukprot:TRINITY_DN34023_c1_g1_i1.p1 TRINITY_DN34023_c1_g1~~TRINITY_DN34023_c1_g1_i1.p1  ORF type:complete len:410 (+),score=60.94 TRINITY_DN34023_c1_g1_i1:158-1387(+)